MRPLLGGSAGLVALLWSVAASAEQGVLVIQVSTLQDQPLKGVVLSTKGDGETGPATNEAGKTRLKLAPATKAGSWVTLQVVKSLGGVPHVFISPWDGGVRIPPFENESNNFTSIWLAEVGDKALLLNGKALA